MDVGWKNVSLFIYIFKILLLNVQGLFHDKKVENSNINKSGFCVTIG